MGLELPEAIATVNPVANIHKAYGPYVDLAAAKTAVPSFLRAKGLTVGVLESGKVIEYWWKEGVGDSDLIMKESILQFESIAIAKIPSTNIITSASLDVTYPLAETGQWVETPQQRATKLAVGWDIQSINGIKSKQTIDYDSLYSTNTLNIATVNTADIIILSTSQEISLEIEKLSGGIIGKTYRIKSNGTFTGLIKHTNSPVNNSIITITGLDRALNGGLAINDFIDLYFDGTNYIETDYKTYS